MEKGKRKETKYNKTTIISLLVLPILSLRSAAYPRIGIHRSNPVSISGEQAVFVSSVYLAVRLIDSFMASMVHSLGLGLVISVIIISASQGITFRT